jgi:hypothetical protein
MSCQLTLGQPEVNAVLPDADVARVAVRDGLDLLLRSLNTHADGSHTPGTHGLVKSAKVGVPFATHALDGVMLMDIPGTADPHALHVHETRVAVGKTRLAVLVLPTEKGRPLVLPADAVAELHHSGFLRSMLLAKADDEYDLVVVVNADTQTPARAEQAGELGQLRAAIMKIVRSVAGTLLPKGGEDIEEGAPTKDSLKTRLDVIERRLTVVYLRTRHAAAAVLGYVNSNLRAEYCANPRGNLGAGPSCAPLPVVPSQTEDEVKAVVEATGVPRLLELISAVRSDAVLQLRSVLNGALLEVRRGIMEIDRQTVVLPKKLFDCFEKWSAKELSKKRGACGACLSFVLLSRALQVPRQARLPAHCRELMQRLLRHFGNTSLTWGRASSPRKQRRSASSLCSSTWVTQRTGWTSPRCVQPAAANCACRFVDRHSRAILHRWHAASHRRVQHPQPVVFATGVPTESAATKLADLLCAEASHVLQVCMRACVRGRALLRKGADLSCPFAARER